MAYLKHFNDFSRFFLLFLLVTVLQASKFEETSLRQAPLQTQQTTHLKGAASALDDEYALRLESIGIKLRPGNEHRRDSRPTTDTSKRCKSLIYQAFVQLPEEHRATLSQLTLYYTNSGRRGLGGSGSMVLRCLNVTEGELVGVFLHEMGHLVDSGYLTAKPTEPRLLSGFNDFGEPVPMSDPSSRFYQISWKSEKQKLADSGEMDFVSGYAMTDPFEDFAESYAFYRLHGFEFRQLVKSSPRLGEKYEFMKLNVFGGQEFGENRFFGKVNIWERNYDVTILPFSLKDFLS